MLPARQIHLDFHTAPAIPGVGADFSAAEFIATLQSAHVNSITFFAKCHHGYSYYPTLVGTPHPHLARPDLSAAPNLLGTPDLSAAPDLLGAMVAACRAAGIRVVAYITAVWDELAWETHPEWRQVSLQGQYVVQSNTPFEPGWKNLCLNSGYAEYVVAQVQEVLDRYPVDGVFIDIVSQIGSPCVCAACLPEMRARGIDPLDEVALQRFTLQAEREFMRKVTAVVRAKSPDLSIFHNSRLVMEWDPQLGNRAELDCFSHIEIESLPGGFWGYSHFPLFVRYFQTFDRPLVAMNGRFHTMWGDFGGLRNRAALEFECFQGLAHGAACSIGDQLHPSGKLDPTVYQRIGEVYAEVERREAWCLGSQPLPEIGVLTTSGGPGRRGSESHSGEILLPLGDLGALNVLEQEKFQFQFLDAACDLSPYALVILPDRVELDRAMAARLRAYLHAGGKLLVTGSSGLRDGQFLLGAEMGVTWAGPSPFAPDYLALDPQTWPDIEAMPPVCELPGQAITAGPDTQVLAFSGAPYFNRTWEHFCSHQYTPLQGITSSPVITQHGNVIYIARPLFSEYARTARRVHRQVIAACLRRLLPQPWVGAHTLPSTALLILRRLQQDLLVHLLHYVPQRRGQNLDVIEDVLPLYDRTLRLRAERRPRSVELVPQREPLPFEWEAGYVKFNVPKIDGYQIICLADAG